MRLTSGYSADGDLSPLFEWLWPDRYPQLSQETTNLVEFVIPPPVTPKDLAGVGRRVVQACYDNPSIWEPLIGNTTMAFRHFGLPETRTGLKDLLDAPA